MRIPVALLVERHLDRRFRWPPTIESAKESQRSSCCIAVVSPTIGHVETTDLCISPADELTPLHNNNTIPAKATNNKNRVLVKKIHIARVGGNRDLAAFQLTPPLGRSIAPLGGLFTTLENEWNQSVGGETSDAPRITMCSKIAICASLGGWDDGGEDGR
jgi:hypothetical protein